MKLLVLAPILPDSPSDGDKLRLFHILKGLSGRHEITLACFGLGQAPDFVREAHVLPMARELQWVNAGLRFFNGLPANVNAYASSDMAALVDGLIGRAHAVRPYDALYCYRLRMAPYALRFRGRRVIDYTDSLTRYFERRAVQASGFRRRAYRREAERIAGYEQWTAEQFDACFMNSSADAATLQAMAPSAKIRVASNGADLGRLSPGKAKRDPDSMVFIGNLAYPPNAEAVLWFANAILPRIRAKRPKAKLKVLGENAPASFRALEDRPGLEFAGFAPDLQPALWGAGLSVCPVRLAAGRQNKILDAWATGTPVVATRLTAAGVEAQDGRQLLAAEDAEGFAAACLKLMQNPGLGRRLAAQALKFVRKHYDWKRAVDTVDRELRA